MKPKYLDFFLLFALFTLSRLLLFWQKIGFDVSLFDFNALRYHPTEAVWYFHSIPPLFHFLTAWSYELLSPMLFVRFWHLIFLLGSFLGLFLLFDLIRKIQINRFFLWLTVFFYLSQPSIILYEKLLHYDLVVFVLLISAFWLAYHWLKTSKAIYAHLFFWNLAILALSRSLFHVFWIGIVIGILLFFGISYKRIWKPALFPILLVFSLFLKNYFMFGFFGNSSWLGSNLIKFTLTVSQETKERLYQEGKISPYYKLKFYAPIEEYLALYPLNYSKKYPNIPILDDLYYPNRTPNFNHVAFIAISKQCQKDAIEMIKANPQSYAQMVLRSFELFWYPTYEFLPFYFNKNIYKLPYANYFSMLFGSAPDSIDVGNMGIYRKWHDWAAMNWISLLLSVFLGGHYAFLWLFRQKRLKTLPLEIQTLLLLIVFHVVFIQTVSILFEYGENMRQRFYLLPLQTLFLAYYLRFRLL